MRRWMVWSFTMFWLVCPSVGMAQVYLCKPDIKYTCNKDGCSRETEGFQHAEVFEYNKKTAKLSACLWDSCYEGNALVFKEKASGAFTVIGKLLPAHRQYEPMTVSLTIDKNGNFTCVWGYGADGLTFDMGKYKIVK